MNKGNLQVETKELIELREYVATKRSFEQKLSTPICGGVIPSRFAAKHNENRKVFTERKVNKIETFLN